MIEPYVNDRGEYVDEMGIPWYDGPFYDSSGRQINVGDEVAYNYSGAVHLGKVIRIGRVKKSRYSYNIAHNKCVIEIENTNDGRPSGTSTVRNPQGIRVL